MAATQGLGLPHVIATAHEAGAHIGVVLELATQLLPLNLNRFTRREEAIAAREQGRVSRHTHINLYREKPHEMTDNTKRLEFGQHCRFEASGL